MKTIILNIKNRMLKIPKWIFLFIIPFLSLLLLTVMSKGIYSLFSDDLVQYRIFNENFINQILSGTLNSFDLDYGLGQSQISNVYYISFDIFTLLNIIGVVLKIPFDWIYSINLILLLSIGNVFFYFILRKIFKLSVEVSFFVSLMYFVCGNSVFLNYPQYALIQFYFPLTFFIDRKVNIYFKKFKPIVLPLVGLILCLYNFYIAYSIVLGTLILSVSTELLENGRKNLKHCIFENFASGCLYLVGAIMSMFMVYPAIVYYLGLKNGSRDSSVFIFNYHKYIFLVVNSISANSILNAYGFTTSYILAQGSVFITQTGLMILFSSFNKENKNHPSYKRIKITLFAELICLLFPVFYMLFSLQRIPYSRWYFVINNLNLFMIGNIWQEFKNKNAKQNNCKMPIISKKQFLPIMLVFFISSVLIVLFTDTGKKLDSQLMKVSILLVELCVVILLFNRLNKNKNNYSFLKKTLIAEFTISLFISYMIPYQSMRKSVYDTNNDYIKLSQNMKEIDLTARYKIITLSMSDTINKNIKIDKEISDEIFFHSFHEKEIVKYIEPYMNKESSSWVFSNLTKTDLLAMMMNEDYYVITSSDSPLYYKKEPKDKVIPSHFYNNFILNKDGRDYYRIDSKYSFDYIIHDNNQYQYTSNHLYNQLLTLSPKSTILDETNFYSLKYSDFSYTHDKKTKETSIRINLEKIPNYSSKYIYLDFDNFDAVSLGCYVYFDTEKHYLINNILNLSAVPVDSSFVELRFYDEDDYYSTLTNKENSNKDCVYYTDLRTVYDVLDAQYNAQLKYNFNYKYDDSNYNPTIKYSLPDEEKGLYQVILPIQYSKGWGNVLSSHNGLIELSPTDTSSFTYHTPKVKNGVVLSIVGTSIYLSTIGGWYLKLIIDKKKKRN